MIAYRASVAAVTVDEPTTGPEQEDNEQAGTMTISTTYAPKVAAPAADARACALVHGDQWRRRMGTLMAFTAMNGTSIKRTTRRLGKLAT